MTHERRQRAEEKEGCSAVAMEMKTKTIECSLNVDLLVDATVCVMTGKPIVVIDLVADLVDGINLTPDEAESLAATLVIAADCARNI